MKTMARCFAVLAIFALMSPAVRGQVTLPHYDAFNYPPGQNLGAQTGWASLNSGDTLFTAAGSLSYPGFAVSSGNKIAFDGAGLDAAKLFDSVATGTVYYSYLLRVTSVGTLSATGGYFTTFYQSPTSVTGGTCVWTRLDGTAFDIGISVRITSPVSWSSIKALNATYLIVASYEFVSGVINDVSKIWINPDVSTFGALTPPTETLTSTNNTTDLTGVARVQIRQDAATTTPFIEMDELRIGTTWAAVTPASGSTSVLDRNAGLVPRELRLEQNYPNPFNPSTTIQFSIAAAQMVTVKIHDMLGREVATLVDETLTPGTYSAQWQATANPSGIYFYTIRAGNASTTRHMILVK
jgi:hypothetical protein